MAKFEKEISSINYNINLSKDDMLKIFDRDLGVMDYPHRKTLSTQLKEYSNGISNVDYNGHFGPYIFLTIEAENNNDETWEDIFNIISEYIEES